MSYLYHLEIIFNILFLTFLYLQILQPKYMLKQYLLLRFVVFMIASKRSSAKSCYSAFLLIEYVIGKQNFVMIQLKF